VLVRGRLRVREYEGKDGSRGTETEVDASSIGHDLSRGVAHFSRTRRAPGETAAESAETPATAQSQDGEEQDRPAGRDGDGPAAGTAGDEAAGGVLDDGAVAEFASEMSRSLEGTPA
jgi:single-strand DNA-binding protein